MKIVKTIIFGILALSSIFYAMILELRGISNLDQLVMAIAAAVIVFLL
jgi:hypothetical protein